MTLSNRRSFLKCSAAALASTVAASGAGGCAGKEDREKSFTPKTFSPKKPLVLWYSQAGHTRRIGRVLAHTFRKRGLACTAADIRDVRVDQLPSFDLIVVGTPVFYYDVPEHPARILQDIPRIDGTPAASFTTYGGPGNNQHNTAVSILEKLQARGGVPIDLETFGNMSTFAPTWSIGNRERVLAYKHLPNRETYAKAREFAARILGNLEQKRVLALSREVTFDNFMKHLAPIWFTKLLIGEHSIDGDMCIGCGTCVEKCPVDAAHPEESRIDRDRCVACMGCINNCPEQAVKMVFMGHDVYGFQEFLKQSGVSIVEPNLS